MKFKRYKNVQICVIHKSKENLNDNCLIVKQRKKLIERKINRITKTILRHFMLLIMGRTKRYVTHSGS